MVTRRIEAIRLLPRKLRVRAILAALNSGEPDHAQPLGQMLLELASQEMAIAPKSFVGKAVRAVCRSGDRSASIALAARLAVLIPEHQHVALAMDSLDWEGLVAVSDSAEFPQDSLAKRSLACHAAITGRASVAPAIVRSLSHPDTEVSGAAESALQVLAVANSRYLLASIPAVLHYLRLGVAGTSIDPGRWAEGTDEDRVRLGRSLAGACAAFESHRRRGPLIAAMIFLDRTAAREAGSPLAAWLGLVDHPSHTALAGVLRWCRLPVAGVRCWEWMWRDDLAVAASDRLMRAVAVEEQDAILSRAPLALRPVRARRLAEMDLSKAGGKSGASVPSEGLIPHRSVIPTLSRVARRGLPLIASKLRGTPKARQVLLEPLLVDPDPLVRHALVRTMPLRARADLCFDADARVARSAFLAWSSAGHFSDPRAPSASDEALGLVCSLTRSPHEAVRLLASREYAWAHAQGAGSLEGRLKLRRRLRRDRAGEIEYLAAQILGNDGNARYLAVMLVRRLDLAAKFERELVEVARGGIGVEPGSAAARAAASGAAALGDVAGEMSIVALRSCLGARDGRLRANAVEALGRQARRRPLSPAAVPAELVSDAHHRVRGNAVRALVTLPQRGGGDLGSEGLMGMLSDKREMHRAAGAWAAGCALRATGREHLGARYAPLLAQVCEMARFDESPAVRRRATLAAAQAQTELRAIIVDGWSSGDAPQASVEQEANA